MAVVSVGVRRGRERGQGMTEYIIIVALVAIAAVGVYSFFGQSRQQPAAGAQDQPGKAALQPAPAKGPQPAETVPGKK